MRTNHQRSRKSFIPQILILRCCISIPAPSGNTPILAVAELVFPFLIEAQAEWSRIHRKIPGYYVSADLCGLMTEHMVPLRSVGSGTLNTWERRPNK